MAEEFYATTEINRSKDTRTCLAEPQIRVLLYVLASQICRLDGSEPQCGRLMISGVPTGEDAEWIAKATIRKGDFYLDELSSEALAEQSISAAASYPDIDLHYTRTTAGSEQLQDGAHFDENLGVLVLTATGGRLLLTLQLAIDESGEEYAKENLLKAYAATLLAFQHMTPKDKILQESCVTALNDIIWQYSNCMCCDGSLLDDLSWIKGSFERGRQQDIWQWKLWREEHPELKAYFRDK